MKCNYSDQCGRLCPHFVVTSAVTFADGTLTLNLPDTMSYDNCGRYCIVIGQTIPAATTITAPVVVTVGTGTTEFPLLTCGGAQALASQLATRTVYPVKISTTTAGGSVRVLRRLPHVDTVSLASLNSAATAAAATGEEGGAA